jgi:hypothetical protein
MTTTLVTTKSTGLSKTSKAVRELAGRLERARQSHNEKHARADAEYVDAVRRAYESVAAVNTPAEQDSSTVGTEPEQAAV